MMQFGKGDSPCKHCEKKGCGAYHNMCPDYLAWRKELDDKNEAERLYHEKNNTMSDAKRKANWRSKRYSRQLMYNKSTKAD